MSRRISVQLNDGLYRAAQEEAHRQGRSDGRTDGVASLMRGALRGYLNRVGYKVSDLDGDGSENAPGSWNQENQREPRI